MPMLPIQACSPLNPLVIKLFGQDQIRRLAALAEHLKEHPLLSLSISIPVGPIISGPWPSSAAPIYPCDPQQHGAQLANSSSRVAGGSPMVAGKIPL